MNLRPLQPDDFDVLHPVLEDWWDGRPVQGLLPRLFFEHFTSTSFVVEEAGQIIAFLVGFLSQSQPALAYIHFVGVAPAFRSKGIGRLLYEKFITTVAERGCREIHAITSPVNLGSINFHQRLGFEIVPGNGTVNGYSVQKDHAGAGQHRVLFRKLLADELSSDTSGVGRTKTGL